MIEECLRNDIINVCSLNIFKWQFLNDNCNTSSYPRIMEEQNNPECSHNLHQNNLTSQSHHSNISQEVANTTYSQITTPNAPKVLSTFSNTANSVRECSQISQNSLPINLMKQGTIASQLLESFRSPVSVHTYPQSLFLQALSKLNENTLSCVISQLKHHTAQPALESSKNVEPKLTEISPPDSLTSAPPSYSFVLRQMAVRRPRLMGTFIPSPSFVQHTPPPNYATAFDIYVDNPIAPPPPTRVYAFGFTSMPVVCHECGFTGMTVIRSKITLCTHMCSLILCLLCCWVCAPLPYIMRSCKEVYHYCRNCRQFLGRYCPTNPDYRYPCH